MGREMERRKQEWEESNAELLKDHDLERAKRILKAERDMRSEDTSDGDGKPIEADTTGLEEGRKLSGYGEVVKAELQPDDAKVVTTTSVENPPQVEQDVKPKITEDN